MNTSFEGKNIFSAQEQAIYDHVKKGEFQKAVISYMSLNRNIKSFQKQNPNSKEIPSLDHIKQIFYTILKGTSTDNEMSTCVETMKKQDPKLENLEKILISSLTDENIAFIGKRILTPKLIKNSKTNELEKISLQLLNHRMKKKLKFSLDDEPNAFT